MPYDSNYHTSVGDLTTSTCNAACYFCPYPEAKRWGGLMDMNLYRKIIDEAATIESINSLILHGLGEPLLDPKLNEKLTYARKMMPDIERVIYTNGVYLSKKLAGLVEAGLTKVVISLNAVNAEQHENIMKLKGKFDQCVQGTEKAITSPLDVEVHAVVSGDYFTKEDGEQFHREWGILSEGGYGQVIVEGNWAGDIDRDPIFKGFKPNEHCYRATDYIYVMYDGRVTTCCFDPTGKQIMGDLNKETLREMYRRDPYLQFRKDHVDNKADLYDICANCTRI